MSTARIQDPVQGLARESALLRAKRLQLLALYEQAAEEIERAIGAELATGRRPDRIAVPIVSRRSNGLPIIQDAPLFSREGPIDFTSLLEPAFGDDAARLRGKYPAERFPSFHRLKRYILENPETTPAFRDMGEPLLEVQLQFNLEYLVNTTLVRSPPGGPRCGRRAPLDHLAHALFSDRLPFALAVPVALLRFDVDRRRLGPHAYLIRMSEALQRARWAGRASGANGHDSVLAAATHMVVFTGWSLPNDSHWRLVHRLAERNDAANALFDAFFAALRIVTGAETGYAQELRIARGWRLFARVPGPEVFAAGARCYPDHFDDFGWLREALPVLTGRDIDEVGRFWCKLQDLTDRRLLLAVRRLNVASTRFDPADTILDVAIALEVLLGDGDGQAIGWKLQMRGAALIGLTSGRAAVKAMRRDLKSLYELRSAIVHGGTRRRRKSDKEPGAEGKELALRLLRCILRALVDRPRYLDPALIDAELLLPHHDEQPGGGGEFRRPADGAATDSSSTDIHRLCDP